MFYESKSHVSYDASCNNLPMQHIITPVLADIPQQSIQSCTPLVYKQFAPGFHSDLMTG